MDDDDSSVVRCLQDYVEELTNPICKQQVGASTPCAPSGRHIPSPLASPHPSPIWRHTWPRVATRAPPQVRQYQQLAAEDIRFNVPLADACHADRQTYCANVPPVSRLARFCARLPPHPQATLRREGACTVEFATAPPPASSGRVSCARVCGRRPRRVTCAGVGARDPVPDQHAQEAVGQVQGRALRRRGAPSPVTSALRLTRGR